MTVDKALVAQLTKHAYSALSGAGLLSADGQCYKKGVKGKMSGFGAAIVTNGLKPALLLYGKLTSGEGNLRPLSDAVLALLRQGGVIELPAAEGANPAGSPLFLYVMNLPENELALAQTRILSAIVACKLFLATLKEEEKKPTNDRE